MHVQELVAYSVLGDGLEVIVLIKLRIPPIRQLNVLDNARGAEQE